MINFVKTASICMCLGYFGCGKNQTSDSKESLSNSDKSSTRQADTFSLGNQGCSKIGPEFRCEPREGTTDIGDGVQKFVWITNNRPYPLRLKSISVPWFSGKPTGCFAEYGFYRNLNDYYELDRFHLDAINDPRAKAEAKKYYKSAPHIIGQKIFNQGELGFSPKQPHERTIKPLENLNIKLDPGDQIAILGSNCGGEVPMTYRVSVDRKVEDTNQILRMPYQDRTMWCQGENNMIEIEDSKMNRTWKGPWQNNTGEWVAIRSTRVYAVSGSESKIDHACLKVCEDVNCRSELGKTCSEKLKVSGAFEEYDEFWVGPGNYVKLEAKNACKSGDVWNYVLFVGMSPKSKKGRNSLSVWSVPLLH